jgi:predicted  nucleic acid-binding Zn-ribbon protein
MARKIISWILIVLSAVFLLLSVAGMGAAWVYNEPLTSRTLNWLSGVDGELSQAQVALESSRAELERALRLVDATEKVLEKLSSQSASAENLLDGIQNSLDDKLLPELKTTRARIDTARGALEELRALILSLGTIPFIDINIPDSILTDLIDSANSLDSEIANVEEIARQASTFVSDTSYLLGGDLTETRDSLENFLAAIKEYEQKVTGWRAQIADLIEALPRWIDRASIYLTGFLLWFGLSQFSLLLHGLSLQRGTDPLDVLRRAKQDGMETA